MKKFLLSLIALVPGAMPLLAQPVITQPPTNQVLAAGATLTLSVTASDPLAAYQWLKDSRLLVGATNSTLMVTNAGVINSGTYTVVVTNVGGMVISLPALVAVGNPTLLAWGYNDAGQFGNGTYNDNPNPSPVSVASNVVAGAVGTFHSLFVTTDGTLWAMGWNYEGQLGNGMYTAYHIPNPTPISVASNVVAVAAGEDFSLFVTTDGTLWAMGDNDCGQLGNGTFSTTNLPVSVTSNVVTVAVGEAHSLFVKTDGTLWAMGLNNYGQLGSSANVGTDNPNNTPISVASNVVAVAGGHWHSLFVTSDGRLWAMGDNEYGQLGNSTYTTAPNPTPVSVASNVVAVAAGMVYSLFVKMDGTLWAMGVNDYGQLGNGTTLNASTPVNVAHLFVANIFPADQA